MAAVAQRSPLRRALGEGISEVIDRFAGAVDGRLLQQEAVHLVTEADVLDSHPCRAQTLCIRASFVP